ncbi:MAG: hypothetical protein ACYTGW_22835 [Planctomycetota bacterium]
MVRPLDFVRNQLRMNPEATFEEVRARAHLEDVKVHQTTYGRARSQLGLVPPKTQRRREPEEPEAAPATPRLPSLGPSMAGDLPADLASMVDGLRQAIVEKDRYRVLMETVLHLFQEALVREDAQGFQEAQGSKPETVPAAD